MGQPFFVLCDGLFIVHAGHGLVSAMAIAMVIARTAGASQSSLFLIRGCEPIGNVTFLGWRQS